MTESVATEMDVRQWAMARWGDAIPRQGRLPQAVIDGYNRAHPDRPHVQSEALLAARRQFREMNDAARLRPSVANGGEPR